MTHRIFQQSEQPGHLNLSTSRLSMVQQGKASDAVSDPLA